MGASPDDESGSKTSGAAARTHTKFSHDTCGGLTLYWTAENAKLDCCLHLLSKACPRRGRGMQLLALSPKGEDEEADTEQRPVRTSETDNQIVTEAEMSYIENHHRIAHLAPDKPA